MADMGMPNMGMGMGMPNFGANGFSMPNMAAGFDPSMFSMQHFLNMPAFGLNRESQERKTELVKHLGAYMKATQAYNALQSTSMKNAVEVMQSKLEERNEPGRQLDSLKAVYDLWIDSLEESFAKVALSTEYQTAYGALVDAQMRVKANVNKQIELATGEIGMPTRTELEGVHQKLADVRRTLRAEIASLKNDVETLKALLSNAVPTPKAAALPRSESTAPKVSISEKPENAPASAGTNTAKASKPATSSLLSAAKKQIKAPNDSLVKATKTSAAAKPAVKAVKK
jgi:polyhydroxyalkanoate synthase subunit PhaE